MATQYPGLAGYTGNQLKDFYTSPNFNPQTVNQGLQATGVNPSALLGNYNQIMGTNVSPTQGASWLTGMSEADMGQWLGKNAGNPSAIGQAASSFGLGSNDLSSLYNNYYGTNVTPEQVQSYIAGQPGQTWTPKGVPYSQSSSGGTSFSGMDWSKSPVSFQQIQDQAAQLPQLAQNVGDSSYNRYSQMMREALGNKGNFAGVLNQMGGRNLMGSTVQSDALAKAGQGIMQDIGQKAYDSDIQAQLARMNIPAILAQIAGLGQVSQGTTGSSSYSADPSRPEQIMAGLIQSGW